MSNGGSDEVSESTLSVTREKKRSILRSLAFRGGHLSDSIFGKRRMLRVFLNSSHLVSRLAFERSNEIYGAAFTNNVLALSEDLLDRWIGQNDSVVDIGCGGGRWSQVVAKYARSVVGIDRSKESIELARSNSTMKNVEYVVGDVPRDLAGREFDVALFVHVLEHLDHPDEVLKELRTVTKKVIVEVPDFDCDPLNLVRLKLGCPFYSDADHVREYTQSILNDQLERNGWTVLENWKRGSGVLAVAERSPA
jgi:SAM-dependent methyltransferase